MVTKQRSKAAKSAKRARAELLERTPQSASETVQPPPGLSPPATDAPPTGMITTPATMTGVSMNVSGEVNIEAMKKAAVSRYRTKVSQHLTDVTEAHRKAMEVHDKHQRELQRLLKEHGQQLAEQLLMEFDALLKKHKVRAVARQEHENTILCVASYADKLGGPNAVFFLKIESSDAGRRMDTYHRDEGGERFCFSTERRVPVKELPAEIQAALKTAVETLKLQRGTAEALAKWRLKYEQVALVAEEIEADISRHILGRTVDGQALLAMIDERIDARALA